ncbi:dUTP diphosphatase [Pseudalkalibacillus caeni]|uniref:dUTPase n=1 Tax=Exobacillus caeni TaxID=2574798 RepID=A0A5R9FEZ8_9BACL|nr:dUTP diphosphatase [Pseudalkalibacillus caeni]TLS39164.1 dUTPase [Pseudalkalibacillus caeni]
MNVTQLFQMQKNLDDRILEEHKLERDEIFHEKLLALQVEIGELANETRCFKYWSLKPPADKNVILEEFVDGIHFILSIGIDLGYELDYITPLSEKESLVSQFHSIIRLVSKLGEENSEEIYSRIFSAYLALGNTLGYSDEEISQAYLLKNAINHDRQDEGY